MPALPLSSADRLIDERPKISRPTDAKIAGPADDSLE
jgi:hypothetical protein